MQGELSREIKETLYFIEISQLWINYGVKGVDYQQRAYHLRRGVGVIAWSFFAAPESCTIHLKL